MHGVKRQKGPTSAEAKAARKAKEAAVLESYLQLERTFLDMRAKDDRSLEALEQTTNVLGRNPELYTAWNYRRRILLSLFASPSPQAAPKVDFFAAALAENTDDSGGTSQQGSSPTNDQASSSSARPAEVPAEQRREEYARELLSADLDITTHALRAHPKVYWIWNHRKWCIEQLPEPQGQRGTKWKQEIGLVDRMLDLDPRNFHGWSHRRYVLRHLSASLRGEGGDDAPTFPDTLSSKSPSMTDLELAEKELAYTLRKIEANFSNFSAWHQRTKLLPKVWDAKGFDEEQRIGAVEEELELVKQAMFTDPADQSVWLYHRWLIEQYPRTDIIKRELLAIQELYEIEPDSKWCMQTIAHYKNILAAQVAPSAEADQLRKESHAIFRDLIRVDSDRAARYRDLLRGSEEAGEQEAVR